MITKDTIRALGVFANSQQIEQAINELKAANFPLEKVSVIAKDVEISTLFKQQCFITGVDLCIESRTFNGFL